MFRKFIILMFAGLCFVSTAHTGETLTTKQKEAQKWFEKAYNTDTPELEIEYYTKAIELNPKYAKAYYARGVACDDKGDHDQAIKDYTRISTSGSNSPATSSISLPAISSSQATAFWAGPI